MLTARRIAVAVAVLLLAAFASHAAWWDTMTHKWTPPPLVKEIEAESLQGVAGGEAVDDAAARGGRALAVRPGGRLTWSFEGPHSHYRLIGIVRLEGAPETPPGNDVETPRMFCRLEVTDPKGNVDAWRMRVGPRGVYTNCLDFYFPAYYDGTYTLKLTVGEDSAQPLILDRLEVRDLFGSCLRTPIKTARRLVTGAQVMAMRAESARTPPRKARREVNPLTLPTPEQQELFDRIWSSMPPRNAFVSSRNARAEWRTTPLDEPWGFMDPKTGRPAYRESEYRAGVKTDSPHPDDGWGYRDEKGRTFSWIGTANHGRWGMLLREVKRRADAWLKTGDDRDGWKAVAYLAAMADAWCDLDSAVQGDRMLNGSGRFHHSWRPGKLGHNFWDLGNCETLNIAYDHLFPLIEDNDELARMIGRHVPWVRTPADVVEYFDVQLVQHAYDLMQRGVVGSSGRIPKAKIRTAMILAPGKLSEDIMEGVFTFLRSDLASFYGGLEQQLWCEYQRDGTSHTNGAGYAKGQAASLYEIAGLAHQYVELGGSRRYDLLDLDRLPFMKAALYFPIIYRVAGGYVPGLGDWGRPWRPRELTYAGKDDGPVFREMYQAGWRLTGDPMFAWMLVNTYGRLDEDDATWAGIVAGARQCPRPPVLSQPPRVFHGYGLAVLEDGVRHDDFHKKTAGLLRFGWALGHGHADTLNLDIYAKGIRVAPDMGSRQGKPNPRSSRTHCLVEVDGRSFGTIELVGSAISSTGWLTQFHAAPRVQFAAGEGRSELHPYLKRFERQVALVGAGEDDAYFFDVFRVKGGKMHTWCFHGGPIDDDGLFECNAGLKDAAGGPAKGYLRGYGKKEGVAQDPLIARWQVGAKWHKSMMRGVGYEEGKTLPVSVRAYLFGHKGDLVMTDDCDPKHSFYGCLMRFLYVQSNRTDGENSSVWPAVYEPMEGEQGVLREVRRIDLGVRDAADAPVAMSVVTRSGRRDLFFASDVAAPPRKVQGCEMSGTMSFWSEDGQGGFQRLMLVGGSRLGRARVLVEVERPVYAAKITDISYETRTLELSDAWPAVLAGEHAAVRRAGPNHTSYELAEVSGRRVRFKGSPRVYQSFVRRIDEDGGIVTEIDPTALRADPKFYDGMSAGGADHARGPWRIERIAAPGRTMYLGWPYYNRHQQKITWDDIPDANGDGKRTLTLEGSKGAIAIEITWVSPDGYSFDFAMPEQKEYQFGGWNCVLKPLINEDKSKRWYALYPGFLYKTYLKGDTRPTLENLRAGKGGRAELNFYDLGVGDELRVSSRVSLASVGEGVYELRANCGVTVTVPGDGPVYVREIGGEWRQMGSERAGGACRFALSAGDLGGGILQLAVGEARAKAPAGAEEF